MELQIQDLVSSIRKEGIEAAEKEAETIISDAKKKASEIISKANEEASRIRETNEKEIGILKENARISADQARRDAVLQFKKEVQEELGKLLKEETGRSMHDQLPTLISAALKGEDVSLYKAEVKEVNDSLRAGLSEELKKGLEICPSKNVNEGFRLTAKDGTGYFDCSDEAVTEMLMPYFRNLTL